MDWTRAARSSTRPLVRCLVVLAVVIVSSGFTTRSTWTRSMVAMLGAGAMVVVSRSTPDEFLAEIEWTTLAFFMALFVLVGSLVEVGVIGGIGRAGGGHDGGAQLLGARRCSLRVGGAWAGSWTTSRTPRPPFRSSRTWSLASPDPSSGRPLWWAFVLGADLGGNTTAVGGRRECGRPRHRGPEGQPISFWQFTKHGLVVTFATLVVAWPYVWLRYYA